MSRTNAGREVPCRELTAKVRNVRKGQTKHRTPMSLRTWHPGRREDDVLEITTRLSVATLLRLLDVLGIPQ
jgi:hypothetical protein